MGVLQGDFIGFQFGEFHSSDLGIIRVSDGSRYNENILPTLTDKTTPRPGSDGTYFFNSFYTQKPFEIPFAFDSLTESQFRQLRQAFSSKKPEKLIFDEAPYKYYMVKISAPPALKYLCFDEGDQRIYKGEGTLSLVAYYPYAKSVFKMLNEETKDAEWAAASGIPSEGNYDIFTQSGVAIEANLYNAGDIEADFTLIMEFEKENDNYGGSEKPLHIFLDAMPDYQIKFKNFSAKDGDNAVRFSSSNQLLEGLEIVKDSGGNVIQLRRTGTIYNEFKESGSFFQLPLGESKIVISGTTAADRTTIKYDYIYY